MKKPSLTLGIVFGGVSPEHEVSVITGLQAIAAAKDNYKVIPLYIDKRGGWHTGDRYQELSTFQQGVPPHQEISLPLSLIDSLPHLVRQGRSFLKQTPLKLDALLPCLHGGLGEGGFIQALAQEFNLPLASSGPTGAVVGMDKVLMKHAFTAANVPQAPYSWFYRSEWHSHQEKLLKEITSSHSFPLFVKPSRGGSSIGTTRTNDRTSLIRAIDLAASLDTRIVVETGITNAREINLSVMGHAGQELQTSVCEEVIHAKNKEFLDFSEKYLGQNGKSQGMASTKRIIPAKLTKKELAIITDLGKQIFRLLDCAGLVRIDFLVKNSQVYVIEVNTIPGSLSFYLWEKSGYSYQALIDQLVKNAIKFHHQDKKITNFSSNILNNYNKVIGTKNKLSTS